MPFLKLKEGKVICTEEGMSLTEVKRIFNNDKTSAEEKRFFNDTITAIYFIYTPRGIYWNKSIEERISIINSDHLIGRTWDTIISKKGVRELVFKYVDLTHTINDKLEDGLKSDINALLNTLKEVPAEISLTLSQHEEVLCDDEIVRKVKIEHKVKIPNFTGKKSLWDTSLSLSRALKEIQENLKQEAIKRDMDEEIERMYDSVAKATLT